MPCTTYPLGFYSHGGGRNHADLAKNLGASKEMDYHPQPGRQNVPWSGCSYIASAICGADDGIIAVCQAVDAGLLQTLGKGFFFARLMPTVAITHPVAAWVT